MNSNINEEQVQSQEIIMPPEPPTENVDTFTPGEFAYASDWDRRYLRDAYQVITRNEWWGQFRDALNSRGVSYTTGFQFTNDPLYNKIMNAIANTPVGGCHSGASIGCVMRIMQIIALKGEAEYRRECIEYEEEERRRQQALQMEEDRRRQQALQMEEHHQEYLAKMERERQEYIARIIASDVANIVVPNTEKINETTNEPDVSPV
uniref:Uncharacterized protein n=1 Tax=viral metagenome TaxID=1070528 RepID=A0A6C0JZB6_9ZZZZ